MTIEELGSIGELIGAVATVATLVYLAVQIRSNSKITRSAALQANPDQPSLLELMPVMRASGVSDDDSA